MDLEDVENRQQLARALDAEDPALLDDIEQAVRKQVAKAWENQDSDELDGLGNPFDDVDDETLLSILDEFTDSEEAKRLLAPLPRDLLLSHLRDMITFAVQQLTARVHSDSVATIESGQGPGVTLRPVYSELHVVFDEPLSWVPSKRMMEFLQSEGPSDAEWSEIDVDEYSSGWFDTGDWWRLNVDRDKGYEWAVDRRNEYFSKLVDSSPDQAIAALFSAIKEQHPDLAKKLKKASLPRDVILDYAVAYFEDEESGLQAIKEAVGAFGYEGTRGEVMLEIDKAALQALGITRGSWWDGAPWKLVSLPPEELLYEGTIQRHCVGRQDMGYRKAVESGQAEIWSLRSRFNKPILTFEVDTRKWHTGIPEYRGQAIEQLKGKLNRRPGEDPDEASVLFWIFAKLGVDPSEVSDFRPVTSDEYRQQANPGFNEPWQPYRQRTSPSVSALRRRLMRL